MSGCCSSAAGGLFHTLSVFLPAFSVTLTVMCLGYVLLYTVNTHHTCTISYDKQNSRVNKDSSWHTFVINMFFTGPTSKPVCMAV